MLHKLSTQALVDSLKEKAPLWADKYAAAILESGVDGSVLDDMLSSAGGLGEFFDAIGMENVLHRAVCKKHFEALHEARPAAAKEPASPRRRSITDMFARKISGGGHNAAGEKGASPRPQSARRRSVLTQAAEKLMRSHSARSALVEVSGEQSSAGADGGAAPASPRRRSILSQAATMLIRSQSAPSAPVDLSDEQSSAGADGGAAAASPRRRRSILSQMAESVMSSSGRSSSEADKKSSMVDRFIASHRAPRAEPKKPDLPFSAQARRMVAEAEARR